MSEQNLIWNDPVWLKEAHDWIRAEAEQNSIQLIGEIEQSHIFHWSTIMKADSSVGALFFKATAGETLYEAALTQKLAGWIPESLPSLISLDINRGWMLMQDGGEQLRASIRQTGDVMLWEPVITAYADLQINLAEHIDEILEVGIPDHRLEVLPALYSQLLIDTESMLIDQEKGLTSSEYKQLAGMTGRVEQLCGVLADFGIPESINHGDFHDGNVLVKDGRITIFDWGDADVTHPFISLRTWFVSMEISLGLDDFAPPTPEMTKLLHRYLECWDEYGAMDRLLKAYAISRPLASIVKTLQWHQSITRMDSSTRGEYAWIVPEVLREFMIYEKDLAN